MAEAVKIEGLREFQRAVKGVDKELGKAVRVAFNDAAEIVVDDARPRVARRRGRAKASVRAKSTQTAARIAGGGARAPYYPWLDFGGSVGRRHATKRPYLADGRYIYRAYRDNRSKFVDVMSEALLDVGRQAGLEMT